MAEEPQDMTNQDIDENISEEQALAQGEAEGLKFVDRYLLAKKDNPSIFVMDENDMAPVYFDTPDEAEDALGELEDSYKYQIVQQRHTIQPEDETNA